VFCNLCWEATPIFASGSLFHKIYATLASLYDIFMKRFITLLCLALISAGATGQGNSQDEKNAVISKSSRQFRFIKGDGINPVQIKELSSRTYACNSYRTSVPVAEFYNNVEKIEDVDIYVDGSKKHGIIPRYEYYSANDIFYSDAHVCYFELPLEKKGSTSKVNFTKTILDPRYFTTIFFPDDLHIVDQEIRIAVPSWMEVEIKELNFARYNVNKKIEPGVDETVYIYTMKDIPATRNESSAPGLTYYAPHLLVLCKSAKPKEEQYTYFKTLKEQYDWYKKLVDQIGDDEKPVRQKAEALTAGLLTEEEKVKKIFQWVQDNIRYIAFEDGIAGFKPEMAQEVLRKKYGDCKGMANLLTIMLRSIKLDARRCWIGTRHIAYDYSTPSLSVDNHMICAWMNKGKPVYLDATEKYIGYGEIAERIQGRQTLIENGNLYLLEKVPVQTHLQNTATESRKLSIDGTDLIGYVVQTWKGENKEWLLTVLNTIKSDKQENALREYLVDNNAGFEISNFKITNINDYNADLRVEYELVWKNALTRFENETYFEINNRRHYEDFKVDTGKRKMPYWFDFKNHLVLETEIILPNGIVVGTIPEKLMIRRPGYSFEGSYIVSPGKVTYKNEIIIDKIEIPVEGFDQWNQDIAGLINFYNQQMVLIDKK
jgi:transglutaminase-like putative cysteine protease